MLSHLRPEQPMRDGSGVNLQCSEIKVRSHQNYSYKVCILSMKVSERMLDTKCSLLFVVLLHFRGAVSWKVDSIYIIN